MGGFGLMRSTLVKAHSIAGGVGAWLGRQRTWLLVIAVVLAIPAGWRTVLTYMALHSDLEELLPEGAPSVGALRELRGRLPGVRYLGVVVDTGGPAHVDAATRFVDALGARIAAYPRELVADVRSDVLVERRFLETWGLQLVAPEDLRELRAAVTRRRDWEVSRAMGADLEDADSETPPPIPIAELRAKYEQRFGGAPSLPQDRFVSRDGRNVVLLVQASSHATGYEADAALLHRVREDVRTLDFPNAFAPGMRIGYAGDVTARVEEMEGLASDLSVAGFLAVGLVLLSIRWFFGNWWSICILGAPLFFGTIATFGLVALPPLSIRYLNTNTGFLASVIVGNGINSGIMLLSRFAEERRRGVALGPAVTTAVAGTWRATLAASLAASTAYGSLVFTDFRGFNQFGYVGGLGMLVCWASMYVFVPAILYGLGESATRYPASHEEDGSARRLVAATLTHPSWVLAVAAVLLVVASAGIVRRSGDWLEQDFSRLRRRDSFVSGERYWGQRMDDTLQRYLTPTIILASDAKSALDIHDQVEKLRRDGRAGGLISSVRSARDILPPTRGAAVEEIRQIARVITPRMRAALSPEDRRLLDLATSDEAMHELRAEMLPSIIVAGMRERDGRVDRSVLVFPKLGGGTWERDRIQAFASDLRSAAAIDPRATVAGALSLSADLTQAMQHDGPRATVLGLLAALVICALAFGSVRLSLLAMGSIGVGVVVMMGLVAWTGARLNFSNFIVLPITFGVAADYSINVLRRYQTDPEGSRGALANATGAVGLCSATTVIGFGSLLAAQNQGLFSFGLLAAIGEISTLATATLLLPAVLLVWEHTRGPSPGRVHGAA